MTEFEPFCSLYRMFRGVLPASKGNSRLENTKGSRCYEQKAIRWVELRLGVQPKCQAFGCVIVSHSDECRVRDRIVPGQGDPHTVQAVTVPKEAHGVGCRVDARCEFFHCCIAFQWRKPLKFSYRCGERNLDLAPVHMAGLPHFRGLLLH